MIFLSLFAAVVGFPAYPTCHPATAAWDYAQLQRLGASDEVAWQLGVVPYHDGTPECQKRVEYSIDFNKRTWR